MKNFRATILSLLIVFFHTLTGNTQQMNKDSISTHFTKGQWLTGMTGGISSAINSNKNDTTKGFSNKYSFDISTSKFFKDRWSVGMVFKINQSNTKNLVVTGESESLFVGPVVSHFLSQSNQGSVFVSISPGYARFREQTGINQNGSISQNLVDGQGIGGLFNLGYAHVIKERIVFNIGMSVTSILIDANIESSDGSKIKDTLNVSDISLSFGFNILLDKFFF